MITLLTSLLAVALVVIALVAGVIAKNFRVKRPHMYLAFIVVALAAIIVVGVHGRYPDSLIVFATAILVYFGLLVLLMGMKTLDALLISIASIAIMGVVLFAGAIALDKYQGSHLMSDMTRFIQDTRFLEIKAAKTSLIADSSKNIDDSDSVDYTEAALMPKGSQKKRIVLKSKAYYSVRPQNAYKFLGLAVRLLKKDGTLLKGTIVGTERDRVVLSMYLVKEKGIIKAPVSFSSIQRLEIYQ